jgi:hypothetical protein
VLLALEKCQSRLQSPISKVTDAALRKLDGNVEALAQLGIPLVNPWPRMRIKVLRARCNF